MLDNLAIGFIKTWYGVCLCFDSASQIAFAFGENADAQERCEHDQGGILVAKITQQLRDRRGDQHGEQAVAERAQRDEGQGADEEGVAVDAQFDGAVDIVAVDDQERGGERGGDGQQIGFNPAGGQGDQFFEQQYGFVHFVFSRRLHGRVRGVSKIGGWGGKYQRFDGVGAVA